MARPNKKGIDYFPKDIDADQDDKLAMIIGEFGLKGEVLFDKLCGWIYKHEGYFMKWEEDAQLRFLKRYAYCGFSLSFILEAVPRLIKWGLFDRVVFDSFHVLTSARIQSTWIEATRKRSSRDIISDYWVIDGVKAEETPKKAEETTQRKVKESKGKEVEEPPPPSGREKTLFEMFKRSAYGYDDDFLMIQVHRFINKYPNCIAAQSGGLVNSWAANLNKAEQEKWKKSNISQDHPKQTTREQMDLEFLKSL